MFAYNVAMAITKRQREVYDFISEFVQRNNYTPSYQEIGNGLGLSSLATVHKHISNLEKKGLLNRDYNRSRSIDLLPANPSKPLSALKRSLSPTSPARKMFSCSKSAASRCKTNISWMATTSWS